MNEKIRRVSKRFPCPICLKPDYCGVTQDGKYAICMRVRSDKQTRNRGYLHSLNADIPVVIVNTPKPAPKSDIEQRNLIYSKLLREHLVLGLKHRNELLTRGLSSHIINRNGYKSVPDTVFAGNVARSLSEFGLAGVPGFYQENAWKMIAKAPGFYIPVNDSQGRIQALQIRQDDGEPRYIWFSSAYKNKGTSSGAPVHFQNTRLIRDTGKAIITEGALKADVIAHLQNAGTVGIAGVSTFPENFGAQLKSELPELTEVTVCFDSDWFTKPQVKHALLKLIKELEKSFKVTVRTWWNGAKGYDDYLKIPKNTNESSTAFCPVGHPVTQGAA